jgi:hypothetical protein
MIIRSIDGRILLLYPFFDLDHWHFTLNTEIRAKSALNNVSTEMFQLFLIVIAQFKRGPRLIHTIGSAKWARLPRLKSQPAYEDDEQPNL